LWSCGHTNPSFTQYPSLSLLFGALQKVQKMADWGPVIIAVVLFVLLSPGLLFQIPGRGKVIEFGNMQTSGASILVHAIIYFGLITILLIAVGVHIYTG
jgi:cytochrome b subunit of formate dehydrogenase